VKSIALASLVNHLELDNKRLLVVGFDARTHLVAPHPTKEVQLDAAAIATIEKQLPGHPIPAV
jgi:hypothetical protein